MDNILKEKLEKIKLLICDVDGVLTDGTLIYTTNGEEAKNFSVLDGVGFHMINRLDIDLKTAWITGRECATTSYRGEKLNMHLKINFNNNKISKNILYKIKNINDSLALNSILRE